MYDGRQKRSHMRMEHFWLVGCQQAVDEVEGVNFLVAARVPLPQRVLDAWYQFTDVVCESTRQNSAKLFEKVKAVLACSGAFFAHLRLDTLYNHGDQLLEEVKWDLFLFHRVRVHVDIGRRLGLF